MGSTEVNRRSIGAENMAATSGSGSGALIDEISHQFLVCQICSESFKRPKTLTCLHTFCEECLEIRYAIEEQERPYRFLLSRSLSCPICHAKTDLPPGGVRRLPSNAVLTQLDDVIRRRKLSAGAQSCDICSVVTSSSRRSTSRATAKCLECSKMMCGKCVEIHRKTKVTKDHCLFDIQVEKDVECKVHREEAVRFYCEQCQSCICVLCTFQTHAGHSIFSFSEGIDRYSNSVRSLLAQARSRSQRLGAQLTALSRCETSLKTAEDAIRNTVSDLISGVRRRERELLTQLRCVYDEGPDGLTTQREAISDILRNINATCDLADVLLQERSVEFLLVHREISEKLSSVLQSPLKELPDGLLNRNIRFKASSSKNVVDLVGLLQVSNSVRRGNEFEPGDVMSGDRPKPNLPSLLTDIECVDSGGFHDPLNNLECVCDRKPVQTSSADVFTSFDCPDRTELMLRGRQSLRPPSPRGPDLWPPPPVKLRRRNHVDQWDSGTETVALETDTRGTSTVSIMTVDRSTLTTLRTTSDRSTTTDWLVTSRDQETFTSAPILLNGSVQTDPPRLSSKSVQSHPETLNKLTMTRKPIQLERETNTQSVARFDCEVTARIIGDDKWTSTPTTILVETGVQCHLAEDFESSVEEVDHLRRGNRRSWKRSSGNRQEELSNDDDDGYDSSLKLRSTEGADNFECPTDRELSELEKYRNQLEESSPSMGGSHVRHSSSSSSIPSFSSSSLLLSSSSSRRVSPSSMCMADDLCLSAETVQRFSQLIEQSAECSSSLNRRDPSSSSDFISSSAFTEELSTLDENDDEEELENLKDQILAERENVPAEQQRLPRNTKRQRTSEPLPIVNKDGLLSAGEFIRPVISEDESKADRERNLTSEVTSSASSKDNADKRGIDSGVGVPAIEGNQAEGGVFNASIESDNSWTAQTKLNDINPSTVQDNTSKDNTSKDNASENNASKDSNVAQQQSRNRMEDKSSDGKKHSDVGSQVDASGKDILKTVESVTTERATTVAEERGGMVQPPDITTDVLIKDQISHIPETPVHYPSNNNDNNLSKARIAIEELDVPASFPKPSLDKLVPSLEVGRSPEISRRRSRQTEQAELDTTPTNTNSDDRRHSKPDLISENPVLSGTGRKSSAAPLPGSSPGGQLENVLIQLERFLPEIRAIATSLDCSSKLSSHSSLVHLLTNISSAIVKKGNLDLPLEETTNPLNSSESVESNGPSSSTKTLHRPIVRYVLVDRAVSPVRSLTRDSQTSTHRVLLVTQGSNTDLALRVDIGVQTKHTSTCDRETSMLRPNFLEKETSTPHVHLLHKNTSTDNQVMVDNQTTMTEDVRSAYLEATTRRASTFSRGTCTPRRPTASDRASSPVRFSCVDKAVLATKADALEPMDTFPGVGKSKARKPFVSSRKAKLECISEGTIDEETEDSVTDDCSVAPSTLSSFRLKMVQRLTSISVQEKQTIPKSFAKRSNNKFSLPISPRPRRSFEESTAFNFDVIESKEEEKGFGKEKELMEELEEIVEIS